MDTNSGDNVLALDMRTGVLTRPGCGECYTTIATDAQRLSCDMCACELCDELCMLLHSLWCSSRSKVLGNLFDRHLCRYYAVHEFVIEEGLTREEVAKEVAKVRVNGEFAPVVMTPFELKYSAWEENTVCIDVECLFFALANHRFPDSRAACDDVNLSWHCNSKLRPIDARRDARLAAVGMPFPCTILLNGARERILRPLDMRKVVKIDAKSPSTNAAYLFLLADCSDSRRLHDHTMMLRICGKTSFLVQAYASQYTFHEWCDWKQPLICNSQKYHNAKRSGETILAVDPQPKFRGLLAVDQVVAFIDELMAIVDGSNRVDHWRQITGVHETEIPTIRVVAMRIDLTAPAI